MDHTSRADAPEDAGALFHTDAAFLQGDIDVAKIDHIQRSVWAKLAVRRPFKAVMRQERGRPGNAVDRKIVDLAGVGVHSHYLEPGGSSGIAHGGDGGQVTKQGHKGLANKAKGFTAREIHAIRRRMGL